MGESETERWEKSLALAEPAENECMEKAFLRIAHMFSPYREDPIMRELCRLAVKSVREGWIGV